VECEQSAGGKQEIAPTTVKTEIKEEEESASSVPRGASVAGNDESSSEQREKPQQRENREATASVSVREEKNDNNELDNPFAAGDDNEEAAGGDYLLQPTDDGNGSPVMPSTSIPTSKGARSKKGSRETASSVERRGPRKMRAQTKSNKQAKRPHSTLLPHHPQDKHRMRTNMAASTKTTSRTKALARRLLDLDERKMSKKLLKQIEGLAEKMFEDMSTAAGEYLHHLDSKEDSEDEVKAAVKSFPSALSHLNDEERLPIYSAVMYSESAAFVPLLAEVGDSLNVGGEGMRGGLLDVDPDDEDNDSVLQLLVNMADENDTTFDSRYLDVLIKLRESNLLRREDIRRYNLFAYSCFPSKQARFEYLVGWDPQVLKDDEDHYSLVRDVLHDESNFNIDCFAMALKAGMKHFPDDLGFLFEKEDDDDGKTICQLAFEKIGKDEALRVIRECIPVSADYPILHHVIKNAPEYMNDFARRYPSAILLRDENGRSFHHVALSSGKNLQNDHMFFLNLRDVEIGEKDPVTDLYPFMNAASAKVPDVETTYYLLRRNPSVVDRSRRIVKCESAKKKAGKKRKR